MRNKTSAAAQYWRSCYFDCTYTCAHRISLFTHCHHISTCREHSKDTIGISRGPICETIISGVATHSCSDKATIRVPITIDIHDTTYRAGRHIQSWDLCRTRGSASIHIRYCRDVDSWCQVTDYIIHDCSCSYIISVGWCTTCCSDSQCTIINSAIHYCGRYCTASDESRF